MTKASPSLRELMFPGASAKRVLEVMTAANTVSIALSLNASEHINTIWRRYPGSDPLGFASEAHQIPPVSLPLLLTNGLRLNGVEFIIQSIRRFTINVIELFCNAMIFITFHKVFYCFSIELTAADTSPLSKCFR